MFYPLDTLITSSNIKCSYSSYICVLFYQVWQNSQYCITNLIFKIVQRRFLGSYFTTPGQWFGYQIQIWIQKGDKFWVLGQFWMTSLMNLPSCQFPEDETTRVNVGPLPRFKLETKTKMFEKAWSFYQKIIFLRCLQRKNTAFTIPTVVCSIKNNQSSKTRTYETSFKSPMRYVGNHTHRLAGEIKLPQ